MTNGEGADARAETVEACVSEARQLGEQARWGEALERLLEALEEQGDDPLLFCWLGIAAERVGEDAQAFEFFRRALALEPTDPFVLAAAGTGVAALDDPAAEGALRTAALTAPDFPFARAAYGAYLAREGLVDDAIAELVAARDLAPDDAAVRTDLAIAYLLARRREEAVEELEEALAAAGDDDSWVRALYGAALVEAGRMEQAAEELHRAAADRPEDVEVNVMASLAAAAEGWNDQAWDALARAELSAVDLDLHVIEEAEELLEAGPDAAAAFLRDDLVPSMLRERLRQRG